MSDARMSGERAFADRLAACFPDGPLDNTALAHIIAATVPGLNAHFRAENFHADFKRRLAARRARLRAVFDGPMSCGHHVERGDWVARTGDGRLICEDCAP